MAGSGDNTQVLATERPDGVATADLATRTILRQAAAIARKVPLIGRLIDRSRRRRASLVAPDLSRRIRRSLVPAPGFASIEPALGRFTAIVLSDPVQQSVVDYRRFQRPEVIAGVVKGLVRKADGVDLCHRSVPIRSREQSSYQDDFLVQSEILRCVLDALAGDRPQARQDLLQELAKGPADWPPALLLSGMEALDRGEATVATNWALRLLAVHSACLAAQRLLYRASPKGDREPSASATAITTRDLRDRFCPAPFTTYNSCSSSDAADATPSVYACCCNGWLPYPLDGFREYGHWEDIWNGAVAQEIRRSVHDGDFTYCSRRICPHIVNGTLPSKKEMVSHPLFGNIVASRLTKIDVAPKQVYLCHDRSCNLACPTCRTEIFTAKTELRDHLDRYMDDTVLPMLRQGGAHVSMTGSGDPFASKHFRRTLAKLAPEEYPGTRLELLTNGLLLTSREWQSIGRARAMVQTISVSIDAATKETYEEVRRPGKWETILANMEFIGRLRRDHEIRHLIVNFVVQRRNYLEMPHFVELGEAWGADKIQFQRLWNFGAYKDNELAENDVADSAHPLHADYLCIRQ